MVDKHGNELKIGDPVLLDYKHWYGRIVHDGGSLTVKFLNGNTAWHGWLDAHHHQTQKATEDDLLIAMLSGDISGA